MLWTTLLLLLATGGGATGHAELHPADTNIFFEVHDVRAVLRSYHETPVVRLIADPEVQGFVAPLTGQEPAEVTLESLVGRALLAMRARLPDLGLQVMDLASDVERASLSVSGIELGGLGQALMEAGDDFVDVLVERLGSVRVRWVLDFSGESVARDASALIRSSLQQAEDEEERTWTLVNEGARSTEEDAAWSIHAMSAEHLDLSLFVSDQAQRLTIVLAFGEVEEEPPVFSDTLAAAGSYRSSSKHMNRGQGVPIVGAYFALSGLGEFSKLLSLLPVVPEEIVQLSHAFMEIMIPGGQIEERSEICLVNGRFVTDVFERSFATSPAANIASEEPVTRENFRMAPADAVGVWGTNLNRDGLHELLLEGLAKASGEDPEEVLAMLEQTYDLRPSRDLISPLGGPLLFYSMPLSGIGLPKMFIVLELDDSVAFTRGLHGLAAYLEAVGGDSIAIREKPYRKQPFVSFSPGKDLADLTAGTTAGGMVAMTPAFVSLSVSVGVLEDRALISLSGMSVKREIKRLLKAKESAEHPVLTMGEEFPADVQSYGSTDWGAIFAGIYDSVRAFLPLIQQAGDFNLPFSIDEMPGSAIFTRYIERSVTWTRVVEGGVHRHQESALGPEIPFLIGTGVGAALLMAATEVEQTDPPEVQQEQILELHPEGQSGPDAQEATRATLQTLKQAIQIYKAEHKAYPGQLSELLQATEAFPKGLLEAESVPADAWGQALHYMLDSDGSAYQLWSSGPDQVDARGKGDDLVLSRQD